MFETNCWRIHNDRHLIFHLFEYYIEHMSFFRHTSVQHCVSQTLQRVGCQETFRTHYTNVLRGSGSESSGMSEG